MHSGGIQITGKVSDVDNGKATGIVSIKAF